MTGRPDNLVQSDFKVEALDDGRGKGGQYAYPNMRSSGVRITYLPTGQSEECYSEKSQLRNREIAMRRLMARVDAGLVTGSAQQVQENDGGCRG